MLENQLWKNSFQKMWDVTSACRNVHIFCSQKTKCIYKAQNLVHWDYSKCLHAPPPTPPPPPPPPHMNILTIQHLIYTQLKQITNRNLRQKHTAARNGKHDRSIVLEKEMSWGLISKSPKRVSVREEGEGMGINSGKSSKKNLEAENITYIPTPLGI